MGTMSIHLMGGCYGTLPTSIFTTRMCEQCCILTRRLLVISMRRLWRPTEMARAKIIQPESSRIAILGELWLGPNPTGSIFNSREELLAAWKQYGPEAMAMWARGGRRPAGWYEFEAS